MKLTVVGLGAEKDQISLSAYRALEKSGCVVLRTEKTLSAATVAEMGIDYKSFDYLYEKSRNFDTLNANICKEVLSLLKTRDVCYVVDGSVEEDLAASKLIQKVKDVTVYEGVSKAGNALAKAGVFATSYTAISAYSLADFSDFSYPLVVYDLDSQMLVSEWKLKLMDVVGEEAKVRLYVDYRFNLVPMYEIDTFGNYDYSTVLIVDKEPLKDRERFTYSDLVDIVKILRGENGCPWDRVQTPETIRKTLIEECYELVDAVNKKDDEKIVEETGDVLLQTAFYIDFGSDNLAYTKADVLSGICSKLISRHTHVFGQDNAKDAESALSLWNKNKQIEKRFENAYQYVSDVPQNFPAALRAEKVVKRAKSFNVYFSEDLIDFIVTNCKKIIDGDTSSETVGDLIFACVSLSKSHELSAEELLADATERFIERFRKIEEAALKDGKTLKNLSKEEVEKYSNEIKKS